VKLLKRFDVRTQQSLAWVFLGIIMLVYSLGMSYEAVLRYDTFKATAFDLGNMDQVMWNTIHGRLFQFTNQAIDWYGPPTRLAIHFEPIILPLSLLYLFFADPRTLLIFQTLALASGALPVFLLTRKTIPGWPLLAPVMVLAYLLSPALLGLNIFDFHPVSLATPLLLYALLALAYKRYIWFLIACILAASCKEDIPLVIAVLGILLIWKYKLPRLGTALIIGGVLWSFVAFRLVIPHFYPGVQANNYWYRYESLGSSPGAAILNIFIRPWLFLGLFFTLERIYYLASLLRSVGFLPLLAPEWLLPTLPSLAVNLLGNDPLLYSGVYHYNAAIIPFLMLSAIHGTSRFLALWQGWRHEDSKERGTAPTHKSVGAGVGLGGEGTLASPALGIARNPPSPAHAHPGIAAQNNVGYGLGLSLLFATPLLALPIRVGTSLKARLLNSTLPARRLVGTRFTASEQRLSKRMQPLARSVSPSRLQWIVIAWIIVMCGLNFWIAKPELNAFWPDHQPGSREQHILQLLSLIPPDASVSASQDLNPHLSERQLLAVFPSVCIDRTCNQTVQYVVVDLNSLSMSNLAIATSELNGLLKQFRIVARAEGVVLLIRRSV
jgi:uncharacterized membrane protein